MDSAQPDFDDPSPIGATGESLLPALLTGAGAAALGGIVWAVVVGVTGYEVGWVAWGIGALVGFAMSRVTGRRDRTVAAAAGGLALAGLIIARLLIGEFVLAGATAAEVTSDDQLMTEALLLDMELRGDLPPDIQSEYDAIPFDSEIPEDLYARMTAAARLRLEETPDSERERLASQFTEFVWGDVDGTSRFMAQLGLFDLLWVLLAVSSAWKFMNAGMPVEQPVAEFPSGIA